MEEEKKYLREYLTEQGPKWTLSYEFEKNVGTMTEVETNTSYPFRFKYNQITFLNSDGEERFASLTEIEKKWIENCVSEILFNKKK